MRALLIFGPLSVFAFVIMLSVGTACGTGYRNGGVGGCAREVQRQYGVLTGTQASSSTFGDAGRASGPGGSDRALVAGKPSGRQETWREVTFWTGRAARDTEPFVIGRPDWRITWSAKAGAAPGGESLRVTLLDSGGQTIKTVASTTGPGSDTVDVNSGAGRYRLKIEATSLEWTVRVEERTSP